MHSVQGRAKCPTDAASVPQRRELVSGTRAAGQGPKSGISNDGSVVGLPDSATDKTFSSVRTVFNLPLPFFRSNVPVSRSFFSRSSKPRLFQFLSEIHSSASPAHNLLADTDILSTLYHHN